MVLDHPRFGALHQHGVDLLLSDVVAAALIDPQQPQAGVGGGGEQPDEGTGQGRQPEHGAGYQTGDALGAELSEAFGHELPYHDGEIGDQHDHDDGGEQAAALGESPHSCSQRAKGWASRDSP